MLTYRVDGDGPPLLLLNGGLMTMRSWEPMLPTLAGKHCVIRCDFRGQLMTPGPYATSLAEHVTDLVDLLDDLRIGSTEVAGVSFGAEAAMLLAAKHPGRVHRLTVFSATAKTDEAMRRDSLMARGLAERAAAGEPVGVEFFRAVLTATWSDAFLARNPGFIEQRLAEVQLIPPNFYEGASAIIRILDDLDLTPHLPAITAATTVVCGAEDRIFPPENSREIMSLIPDARLVVVEGTGHGLIFEETARCLELMS